MSNYTKTTNFATKDALASGNPAKIVKGTEIDTEFNNIAVASGTKADKANPTFTGTVTLPVINVATSLSIGGDGVTVTGIKDEDDMASNSATKLASQQSIKAYVDSQVTAQDLDVTDGTTSISIDLDSEALSLLGGTGVTSTASGNGVTMAIDSTVATLTGTQTLTNKTLTSPDVNTPDIDGGTIDGTVIGGTTAAAGSFTTVDATGNIIVGGTIDGRDVAADGTKLDGIEALADVTDTTNVTAAGALMDSELTSIASVKALDQGVATTDSPTFAAVTSTGGNIDGTVIGGTTAATGSFTSLQFDGLNPTVTYDFNDSGTVTSADAIAYIKLGSGISTGVDISSTPVVAPNWSAATGSVYADNKFRILAAKGNSTDALAVASSNSALGYGDTVVIGNVDVNGPDTKLITGLGINGELITLAGNATATGTLEVADEITANGGIALGDNNKATFGAGDDLQIYHDGSNSYIDDVGTGNLLINADSLRLRDTTGSPYLLGNVGAEVRLYHAGSTKLATTSTGIDVTGKVSSDGLEVDLTSSGNVELTGAANSNAGLVVRDPTATAYGAHFSYDDANTVVSIGGQTNGTKNTAISIGRDTNDISFYEDTSTTAKLTWSASNEDLNFADNVKATFGASDDLQIYHDGSNSYIDESATGSLLIRGSNLQLRSYGTNEYFFTGVENGASTIYYDGLNKLATTATGIDVTGTATMDGLVVDGVAKVLGTASNTLIIADATETNGYQLKSNTSASTDYGFLIENLAGKDLFRVESNGDISFYEDTGTTPKFFWDASAESLGIGGSTSISAIVSGDNNAPKFIAEDSLATSIALLRSDTSITSGNSFGSYAWYGTATTSNLPRPLAAIQALASGTHSAGDNPTDIRFLVTPDGTEALSEAMRIDSSGNLLVGTTSSVGANNQGVQITGTGAILTAKSSTALRTHINFINPNGIVGTISTDGSATAYNTSSDQRLKENITDADDAGGKIDAIQVRQYDWKADGSHQDYGMIAQELLEVAPEAVSVPEDSEEMMGVDYSKLVPMLIKEIQSLRNRVAQLEE